jgi:hypothetical protein
MPGIPPKSRFALVFRNLDSPIASMSLGTFTTGSDVGALALARTLGPKPKSPGGK